MKRDDAARVLQSASELMYLADYYVFEPREVNAAFLERIRNNGSQYFYWKCPAELQAAIDGRVKALNLE